MHTFTAQPKMLIIVAIYFILMVAYSIFLSKKENKQSVKDFALASKSLGTFVLLGTFIASWLGGGTITGSVNSLAYNYGLGPAIWYCTPSVVAVIILYFMGPIVRKRGKMTIAAMLEESYGKTARVISAIIIALSCFAIVSFQYRGMGLVLNTSTGLNVDAATLISCAIIIILAISGGLRTVAYTDAISSAVMLVGLGVAVPAVLKVVGGWDFVVAETAKQMPLGMTLTGGWGPKDFAVNLLPGFLLLMGDQNLYTRMAAARDDKNVQVGMIGWALGMIILLPIIAILGYVGRLYFGSNIDASQSLLATSTIIPWWAGGLMMAAAVAFIITTGDSYLLSGATNISTDVYTHFKKDATDKQVLRATQWSIAIFGVLALAILKFFPSILAIQYWSYTIVGAGVTPALVGCIVCPNKVSKWGGILSMVVGTLLTIVWEILGQPFGVATILVAFPVSVILLVLGSVLIKNKPAAAAEA